MKRVILHCDMNNFYASVECMLDPTLRDKAVVVGGSVEQRHGIVLAKNYKAKAFGIQTGDAIWQAKLKCKDIVVVPPTYEQYLKFSQLARNIYARYTDLIEPFGMDECWLDLTGSGLFGTGEEIAEQIRQAIKFELGLTISIGVSFNKIFAKLGSDMKKPDAITVINEDTFRNQIWQLPANELLGVGRATNQKLSNYGIHTIGQLANADETLLRSMFGINGSKLKNYASGNDRSLVTANDYILPVKSIGHGITTVQDLENPAEVWCVMLSLAQDIGTKLRKHKKKATGVAIDIRNNELSTRQWQCKLEMPTQSAALLAQTAFTLFMEHYQWQHDIRSLTVRAISLVDEDTPVQVDFFTDMRTIEKRETLELTVEHLRQRFGKDSIKSAVLFQNIKLPTSQGVDLIMPTGMVN